VYHSKLCVESKPPHALNQTYLFGLKTLEKHNKHSNTYFNNLSDSVWALLVTDSYFYEKRSAYFENFWLSLLLQSGSGQRKKRFKKRLYSSIK
jgi:hypothetical protein